MPAPEQSRHSLLHARATHSHWRPAGVLVLVEPDWRGVPDVDLGVSKWMRDPLWQLRPTNESSTTLWPVLDEPLANQYFETLADLEHVVTERCRVLNGDQLKPGTNFHWWPKPAIPV